MARVSTRVTHLLKKRLQHACAQRREETARRVPEGEILSELAKYLDPHPDEGTGAPAAAVKRKDPKRATTKKRTAKPTAINSAA